MVENQIQINPSPLKHPLYLFGRKPELDVTKQLVIHPTNKLSTLLMFCPLHPPPVLTLMMSNV